MQDSELAGTPFRKHILPAPARAGAVWACKGDRSAYWFDPSGVDPADAAIVIARLSKEKAGQKESLGLRTQLFGSREEAQAAGKTIVGEFVDDDLTINEKKTRRRKREGYEAALAAVASERVTSVFAMKLDRLYRGFRELERLAEICEKYDPLVRTKYSGDLDLSTATGRAMARMVATMGILELEQIEERVREQKRTAAREGKYRGGWRPFGFEADGVTWRVVEAEAIADGSEGLLKGVPLGAITRDWQARGLTTATGKPLRTLEVRRILKRARNAGLVEEHGVIVSEDAEWDAIVDVDTWKAVCALLDDEDRASNVSFERKLPGSGVYRCGVEGCTGTMRVGRTSGKAAKASKRGEHKVYKCDTKYHLSRDAAPLDDHVERVLLKAIQEAKDAHEGGDHVFPAPDPSALAELYRQRGEVDGELMELAESEDFTVKQKAVMSAKLIAKRETLDEAIGQAREKDVISHLMLSDDVVAEWKSLSVAVKAKIIDASMTVTVLPVTGWKGAGFDPKYVRIKWKPAA